MKSRTRTRRLSGTSVESEAVASVQKACRILSAMSDKHQTRLTDIAGMAGLDKATTLRLLGLLAREGFVLRNPDTKAYSFGRELFILSAALQARTDVRALARPGLVRLAEAFGDTTILSVPSATESVCVDIQFGKFPIRANYLDIGSRRPLGVGAGSLALLYPLPDAEVESVLSRIAKRLDKYPNITARFLEKQVALARTRGYAMLLDVVVERMGGIGVPFPGIDGRPAGAISIAALSDRIASREAVLARALNREAMVISAENMGLSKQVTGRVRTGPK